MITVVPYFSPHCTVVAGDSRGGHGELLRLWACPTLAVPRQGRVAGWASVSISMPGQTLADLHCHRARFKVLYVNKVTGSQIVTLDGVDTVRRARG
jgi:hypothetical protein